VGGRPYGKRKRGGGSFAWAYVAGGAIALALWLAIHSGGGTPGQAVFPEPAATAGALRKAEETAPEKKTEIRPADPADEAGIEVRVYLTETGKIEKVPLETYVKGVVAAEMPLAFEPASLEAQAIAARTYAIRKLWAEGREGKAPGGADVTDTQDDQVYLSAASMRRLSESDPEGWRKAGSAAEATKGEILVYGGEPIEALFFSTSNGYTENSEEAFSNGLPYLRSVPSPWDKRYSPRARETIELSLKDFYEKLGAKPGGKGQDDIRVLERTEGRRVKTLAVGNRKLGGVEARQALGLRSAAFEWKVEGDRIRLTVYGSGHGVGMSQWGAEGMARDGEDAKGILEYYYKGVGFEQVSKLAIRTGARQVR